VSPRPSLAFENPSENPSIALAQFPSNRIRLLRQPTAQLP
jgi:hypothetical protein